MAENEKLRELLTELARRGASDLLLVGGVEASVRHNGEVEKIGDHPLTGAEIEELVEGVLSPVAAEQYRKILPTAPPGWDGFASTYIASGDRRRRRFARFR